MARTKGARDITAREDDMIRLMKAQGMSNPAIGERLGVSRVTIYNRVKKMTDEGTLQNLPFAFLLDAIENRNEG